MVRWESSSGGMGLDVLSPSEPQLHLLEASGQGVPIAQAAAADSSGEERIVAAQVNLKYPMLTFLVLFCANYQCAGVFGSCDESNVGQCSGKPSELRLIRVPAAVRAPVSSRWSLHARETKGIYVLPGSARVVGGINKKVG
jgi:hypothetical protein